MLSRELSPRNAPASIPIPPGEEPERFKMPGNSGTGYSTAIREILNGALTRGDRAVSADPYTRTLKTCTAS
jgi:hypothetical protein